MEKGKYRMIIMDLDGTLLMDDDKSVSKGNYEALREAADKGILIVAATGRSYATVPASVTKMPFLSYLITSNGSVISRMNGKGMPGVIRQTYLNQEIIDTVLQTIHGINLNRPRLKRIVYEAFIEGKAYTDADYYENPLSFGSNPKEMAYIRETRHPVDDMPGLIEANRSRLDSISLICHDQELKAGLAGLFLQSETKLILSDSAARLLEFSNPDCSKWSAIEYLMEMEGILREETIAFGDSGNDLQMIEHAGLGICMGDGKESLKKAADYITSNCMEDGVAKAIRLFT